MREAGDRPWYEHELADQRLRVRGDAESIRGRRNQPRGSGAAAVLTWTKERLAWMVVPDSLERAPSSARVGQLGEPCRDCRRAHLMAWTPPSSATDYWLHLLGSIRVESGGLTP